MSATPSYSRAPITEAIIDLRVELPESVTLAELEKCRSGREASYPNWSDLTVTVGRIEVGPEVSTSASSRRAGFVFASLDRKRIFQARLDGFTLSQLAPYPGWEAFRDEARSLWEQYRELTHPRRLTRLAVRYVNRLDLPSGEADLKEYLRTGPEISPSLPQTLAGFFMQLNIPQPDVRATLLLNEAAVESTSPGASSVLLDLDLFRTEDLPETDDGVWSLLEALRLRKNEIFEACITEKTKGLIR